ARGWHAQVVHGLAAQELAYRGAQHRTTIGGARIRRQARALELELVASARDGDAFAEGDRPPVAELAGPVAELVPAVVGRERVHPRHQRVAGEDRGEGGARDLPGREAELVRHF